MEGPEARPWSFTPEVKRTVALAVRRHDLRIREVSTDDLDPFVPLVAQDRLASMPKLQDSKLASCKTLASPTFWPSRHLS